MNLEKVSATNERKLKIRVFIHDRLKMRFYETKCQSE